MVIIKPQVTQENLTVSQTFRLNGPVAAEWDSPFTVILAMISKSLNLLNSPLFYGFHRGKVA